MEMETLVVALMYTTMLNNTTIATPILVSWNTLLNHVTILKVEIYAKITVFNAKCPKVHGKS